MSASERILEINGIHLCAQSFGTLTDPTILLLHGAGDSMLAWDTQFIDRLVAGGRHVIRYDSRDAGRSTTYPVGAPGYGLRDLVADAVGVLDAFGIERAHFFSMSQGSAVSQLVALDHPERVASLALNSGTPGGPGHQYDDLPGITPELAAYFAGEVPEPDWTDKAAVIEYLVEAERPFAAPGQFDADQRRQVAAHVIDRAADIAAQLTNPFLIDAGDPWRDRLGTITAPTLVLHGTEDPLFPLGHGEALAVAIPGATFLAMPHTGHAVMPKAQWDTVVAAVLELTGRNS